MVCNVFIRYCNKSYDYLEDECINYSILDENARSVRTAKGEKFCDKINYYNRGDWRGTGWYRFKHPAGTRLAQSAPGQDHCGAYRAGWSNSALPDRNGESADIKICFDMDYGSANDCAVSNQGKVTNCGTYFVYYLENTPTCTARYCGSN